MSPPPPFPPSSHGAQSAMRTCIQIRQAMMHKPKVREIMADRRPDADTLGDAIGTDLGVFLLVGSFEPRLRKELWPTSWIAWT